MGCDLCAKQLFYTATESLRTIDLCDEHRRPVSDFVLIKILLNIFFYYSLLIQSR